MPQSENHEWHLDRKVPISFIIAMLVHLAVGLLWAAKLDGRVGGLEAADMRQERLISDRIKLADERYSEVLRERERLIRLEEGLKFQSDILGRIEGKVSGIARSR